MVCNIEATICTEGKFVSTENTLRLYNSSSFDIQSELEKLSIDEQIRCSKRERNQRKKAAKKNCFPVGLRKELSFTKRAEKHGKHVQKNKSEKKLTNLLVKDMLEEIDFFSDEDKAWKLGYSDGYAGHLSDIPEYASEKFKRGYAAGEYIGSMTAEYEYISGDYDD